mmetsp:Transcript_22686/g.27411  ORF Transcript_22686/g.27411 Transcript_22686/m.27411 type:complete len:171 (-) Transcript_22686:146-658(-)|eukprot:CAMPEP_0197856220 /NCGR_PEP_ID=MMETSP1438-20131217/28119_1 /TAXON_ID=1461541 /ORGANISM="Pterosperma sp., Strain CCMP1384" /LENGTH=170 /DNA_ID=CAMNT_0043471601 /DNA_START=172 /DNA_END=684 /DNA_ORIENTATION=-
MLRSNSLRRALQLGFQATSVAGNACTTKSSVLHGLAPFSTLLQTRVPTSQPWVLNGHQSTIGVQQLAASTKPQCRNFATTQDVQDKVDLINEKFAEARDEIELATEDAETVYFNESCEDARAITKECLDMWDGLLKEVDDDTRASLRRSMGLKIEQLKAELEQLNHLHDD